MRIALLGDTALIGRYDRTIDDNVNERILAVKELLKDCDFVVANLESVLSDKKHTVICKGVYLRSDAINVETLKFIGVTHVTLANNHIYDYGKSGALDTVKTLSENNIYTVGLYTGPALLKKGDDRAMLDGFCCLSANAVGYGNKRGDVHLLNNEEVEKFITCAEKNACLPIVSAHFGIEGVHYPSQEHIQLFSSLADRHDYVLHGNHPHAIQGYEKHNNSLLAYALGDFCFDDCKITSINRVDKQTEESRNSYIVILNILGNKLVDYEIKCITDLPNGYLHECSDIKLKLDVYSKNLNLPLSEIDNLRNMELNEQIEKRQIRDKKFYLDRMNCKYVGAYVNGKIHAKKYKNIFDSFNQHKETPIRILCVFSTLDRGGAESMCMNLYRHIDRDKVQFDFVKHTHTKGDFEDEIIELGGRIYEAPRFYEYNRLSYEKWWKQHFINHPEHKIVHGHFFSISDVFLKIAKESGRITIGHSHCTPTPRNQINGAFQKVKDSLYRLHVSNIENNSDYAFACSKAAGQWIFKNMPFKVLNNSIDTKLYKFNSSTRNHIRKELGMEECFVLGTVGRIMLPKNPLGIVDIFAEVCKLNGKARLLWVGTFDTDMGREAMLRAEEKGVKDKIIFTGVVDNVHEMVQAMDCFVFPSYYEGLGIVAVEAQTAGLPCFISDVVPKEVELTDLCTFLPLDDYSRWAEEIVKYNYSERGSYHKEVADAGYDISTTAEWLQNFYLSI